MNEDDWFNKPWVTLVIIGCVFIAYVIYMLVGPKTIIVEKVIKEPQVVEQEVIVRQVKVEKQIVTETKIVEYHWYEFTATGYSANDEEQGTGNLNATGQPARYGTIAVDPNVIPLGTWLEIKDMGWFVAQDTGGAIIGNKIDICFNSRKEAIAFGTKKIWIRYLGVEADEV